MAPEKNSASIPLKAIADWDGVSQVTNVHQVVNTAFEAGDYRDCIKDLRARGINPEPYVNNLDKVIDTLPVDSDFRKRCIRALRRTCGYCGILPASYAVPRSLTKSDEIPFASGGFADVWKVTDEQGMTYAVKSIRVSQQDTIETINKKYCKEVIVCKRASHENILTIEGVARDLFKFCMVSEWMDNGELLKYAIKNPEVNRLNLLIGVTRGLDYLHRNDVVHGDLKSPNILVDAQGRPRLTDFGLCSITMNLESVNASTPHHGCTVRYCAPELLDQLSKVVGSKSTEKANIKETKAKYTKKCDIYSLSMVIVELATGEVPFPEFRDPTIISEVPKGRRPSEPRRFEHGITLEVWKVAKKSWRHKAEERPGVEKVLQTLVNIADAGVDYEPPKPSKFRKVLCHILG